MSQDNEASACPVDHKSRRAWLDHAKSSPHAPPNAPLPTTTAGQSCDSTQVDPSPNQPTPRTLPFPSYWSPSLDTHREISTIPRAHDGPAAQTQHPRPAANHEQETGADRASGNWVYPSEQMFFNAMRRKNYDPQAADMRAIVPIHNAVNERAWREIKEWEKGRGAERYEIYPLFFFLCFSFVFFFGDECDGASSGKGAGTTRSEC
jgi:cytochrome c heme-lyase